MYSDVVMDHFLHPRNKGRLINADAVGRVGNPVCGDVMYIYIKVKNNRIDDIGWETMGCAAAIATSSMLSEIAKGKTLDEALLINQKDVAEGLEGLPPVKMHCSNLAAAGLHKAVDNYHHRDEIRAEFRQIVNEQDAEALFKAGIENLEEMKKTSIESLSNIVSEGGIKNIRAFLKK